MRIVKSSISILISLIMVISLFTIIPFESFAAENEKQVSETVQINSDSGCGEKTL